MISVKKLRHRIGDAAAMLVIGAVMTPAVIVGVGTVWVVGYHYLAVREVVLGR